MLIKSVFCWFLFLVFPWSFKITIFHSDLDKHSDLIKRVTGQKQLHKFITRAWHFTKNPINSNEYIQFSEEFWLARMEFYSHVNTCDEICIINSVKRVYPFEKLQEIFRFYF